MVSNGNIFEFLSSFSSSVRLRKMNVCSPMLVNISVYSGHVSEGFSERVPLASVLTERWYMAPGVKRVKVQDGGVRGTLFIPPGEPAGLLLSMMGLFFLSDCLHGFYLQQVQVPSLLCWTCGGAEEG